MCLEVRRKQQKKEKKIEKKIIKGKITSRQKMKDIFDAKQFCEGDGENIGKYMEVVKVEKSFSIMVWIFDDRN